MDKVCIGAWTAIRYDGAYPPFLSPNFENGIVKIYVRGPQSKDIHTGHTAVVETCIEMSLEEYRVWLVRQLETLNKHPAFLREQRDPL